MAKDSNANSEAADQEPAKSSKSRLLIWGFVIAIGIGAGFATPLVIMGSSGNKTTPDSDDAEERMDLPEPDENIGFIEFDEVVTNIDDPRFSRYVKMNFSLQVSKPQVAAIKTLVEEKQVVLTSWLIAHMADVKSEDLRGKQGHNRLRRQIHDRFNELLFTDGIERIQDVLFKQLTVQ